MNLTAVLLYETILWTVSIDEIEICYIQIKNICFVICQVYFSLSSVTPQYALLVSDKQQSESRISYVSWF